MSRRTTKARPEYVDVTYHVVSIGKLAFSLTNKNPESYGFRPFA